MYQHDDHKNYMVQTAQSMPKPYFKIIYVFANMDD